MSKSPLHSTLSKRLYDIIARSLPPNHLVRREDPITLADSEPEPDISIVQGKESDFIESHLTTADLVIEVAVSSAALDRENATLYAEASVREYWIVLGRESQVEVHSEPKAGSYQAKRLIRAPEIIECGSVPGIRISLKELFAT